MMKDDMSRAHVAPMIVIRNAYKILVGNLTEETAKET
jgi:hypothetical protein